MGHACYVCWRTGTNGERLCFLNDNFTGKNGHCTNCIELMKSANSKKTNYKINRGVTKSGFIKSNLSNGI